MDEDTTQDDLINMAEDLANESIDQEVPEDILPDSETYDATEDVELDSWKRPPVPSFNPKEDTVVLQQLDADYYIGPAHPKIASAANKETNRAIVRMFGATENGNSACIHIHGYEPYFFIQAPPGFNESKTPPPPVLRQYFIKYDSGCDTLALLVALAHMERHIPSFMKSLEQAASAADRSAEKQGSFIVSMSIVQRRSIMYFRNGENVPFLRIVTMLPKNVPTLKGLLEKGVQVPGFGERAFVTFESNIMFVLRFMVDMGIVGGNWIELPAGKYSVRSEESVPKVQSTCQIECDIFYKDLISHSTEGKWQKFAPLRILSFDIECAGRKGHFPEAEHDPVIQIANVLYVQGEDGLRFRNCFTLKTCAPIAGSDVIPSETEHDLLRRWRRFLQIVDPDVITGYNIINFDLPYLIDRAGAIKLKQFPYLGRIRGSRARVRDTVFSSQAYGTRESKEISTEGRVQFDILQAIQRDYKLRSYSLNAVSANFLGEQKEDVHHSVITDLQNGNDETRRRLAVYCIKDAYLPVRLMQKLMFMFNYVEMARVTGVPMSYLLSRGQQIKVVSQLLRKCATLGIVIPTMRPQGDGDKYEGATVIEPVKGFYKEPIATLDFASLYPSIMMAHNLCYTTLVRKEDVGKLKPEQITRTPCGDVFIKSDVQKGILPEVLEELLRARKRAKADLKKATDPIQRAVLDGRQLALKISANSVYGFTGAQVGRLPCLEISSSVTAFGREMIEQTKRLVEARFNTQNGYEHDSVVVYGDTDSVMIKFGVSSIEEAMRLGNEAAEYVSSTFLNPISLEFEKVYLPYLLMNKKRYAGLLYTRPDRYDKMDTKGIETVRRDNCGLVKRVVTAVLHHILINRSIDKAVAFVKEQISDLLQNKVDLSLLIISKSLGKMDYEGKIAHVELAKRMRKRDPLTAPSVGDRVPYVMVKGVKGAKGYEKAEDPIFVLENNIPIDAQYYVDHQLKQPLLRIFEPIIPNPQSLIAGDHTRKVSLATPKAGGIMAFAVKTLKCMGCKAPLSGAAQQRDGRALCARCKPREREILHEKVRDVRDLEVEFNRLWTQCQRCQGSMHQDVLCTAKDCPIFYRRTKTRKDLKAAQEQMDRFAW